MKPHTSSSMNPEYRIMFDHLETDVTGWVVCELIPGFKFDSHREAREALEKLVGRSPASQGQATGLRPQPATRSSQSGVLNARRDIDG